MKPFFDEQSVPRAERRSSSGIMSIFKSYHLTLSLAVDVVAAYLSAGGLGGFALAVFGLDLCHTECKSIDKKRPPRRTVYLIWVHDGEYLQINDTSKFRVCECPPNIQSDGLVFIV